MFPVFFRGNREKLLDDTAPRRETYNLGRIAETQLLQNVCPVSLNSGRTDGQQIRDLLAASSFRDQLKNFPLAL